jgi:hypothetical protein
MASNRDLNAVTRAHTAGLSEEDASVLVYRAACAFPLPNITATEWAIALDITKQSLRAAGQIA